MSFQYENYLKNMKLYADPDPPEYFDADPNPDLK